MTVSGSGFAATSTFSATFAGSPVILSGPTTTDGSGNIPAGVTFTVPASTAGDQSVVVNDSSSNSASATFTAEFGSLDHFIVSAPSSATAGSYFSLSVTAVDAYGNTITTYSSSVGLSASSGSISPTSTGTSDWLNGVWSSDSVTLSAAGSITITADDGNSHIGTASLTVNAGALDTVSVSGPASVTAGGTATFTAIGYDAEGNSLGSEAASWSITNGAGGSWVQTTGTYTSATSGSWTVSALVSGVTGTAPLTVNAADAASFVISGFPSPDVAGVAHSFTVTAKDPYGNVATGYGGTVKITSSDSQALLPPNSVLSSGTGNFTVTLETAGSQSIAATDTVTNSITGSQNGITVTHAAVANVAISPAGSSVTAGLSVTYSATASDAYGNEWDVTSSTSWSISSGAGGSWSCNVYTSATAGSWTVTGTYDSTSYTTGLTVDPGVLDHFVFNNVGAQTVGSAFTIAVTAVDAYGNTVTGYVGTPSLTYSAGSISPGTMNAFVNGVGSTSVTVTAAGSTVTITAVGGGNSGTSNSFTVNPTINASAGPNGAITPSGSVAVNYGGTQTFTITPDTGYHVASLTVDGVAVSVSSSYDFTDVQTSQTIAATYAPNNYTLTIYTIGQGSVTPDNGTYTYGTIVSLQATGASGWSFEGWSNGVTDSTTTLTMDQNQTITATFTQNPQTTPTPTSTATPIPTSTPTATPAETSTPATSSGSPSGTPTVVQSAVGEYLSVIAAAIILGAVIIGLIIRRRKSPSIIILK